MWIASYDIDSPQESVAVRGRSSPVTWSIPSDYYRQMRLTTAIVYGGMIVILPWRRQVKNTGPVAMTLMPLRGRNSDPRSSALAGPISMTVRFRNGGQFFVFASVILALGTWAAAPPAEDAAAYVSLMFEGVCDAQNKRMHLVNRHTYKSIATTVRWSAAGGKALTETFFPEPSSEREIGCAADAAIIDAVFVEF